MRQTGGCGIGSVMIALDANFIIRAVMGPVTVHDRPMMESARAFFRLVDAGNEEFTTSEAVIAEVVFILHSPRHLNTARQDVVARIKPLLELPGCRMPTKRRTVRALDRWSAMPAISFVDALVAELALEHGGGLGTFDRRLARMPGVTAWQPPTSATAATELNNGTT